MRFLLLFALTAALTAAQTNPEALFHQDFETGAPAWSVVGNGGSVRVTRDPGAAHSGQGALAFHYQVKPRQIAAAVMPAPAKFARMQRIRFWLKNRSSTSGMASAKETRRRQLHRNLLVPQRRVASHRPDALRLRPVPRPERSQGFR